MTNQSPPSTLSFLFETSRTPIWQRIICGFRDALVKQGHSVTFVTPSDFKSTLEYIQYIRNQNFDYCVLTNFRAYLATYDEMQDCFLYELIDTPIIFIHHDGAFLDSWNTKILKSLFPSFLRLKDRSTHFCLEYRNFLDLRELGLDRVHMLRHASEFQPFQLSEPSEFGFDLSFVGHVVSAVERSPDDVPHSHLLLADYWNRLVDFTKPLEPSANTFIERNFPNSINTLDALTEKYSYLSLLHAYLSLVFRGDVIKRICFPKIDIFGGSPHYLHNQASGAIAIDHVLKRENICYHPPIEDYSQTRTIYATSKINLNITSLQFDSAVINRVTDVGAYGGFVLTDWKPDLETLTSVSQEISYRSIEELNYKLQYYSHPDHEAERLEIAYAFQQDIKRQCTYDVVVADILTKLHSFSPINAERMQIDLGCGIWKPDGFIGVDSVSHPNVDVVADLTQRFPFAVDSIDVIRAYDIVEHLPDRLHTMNEIWRIAKPGALVDIRVPSTDGRGAFQDPTHVSYWNVNSFLYYCVDFPAYHQLCQSYGFRGAFNLVGLKEERSPDEVVHVRAVLRAIKPFQASSELYTVGDVNLSEVNVLLCPDWSSDIDTLTQLFVQLLEAILYSPQNQRMTLLIAVDGAETEDIELFLADVTMSILAEASERKMPAGEPNIALVNSDQLSPILATPSRITAHIRVEGDRPSFKELENIPSVAVQNLNYFLNWIGREIVL